MRYLVLFVCLCVSSLSFSQWEYKQTTDFFTDQVVPLLMSKSVKYNDFASAQLAGGCIEHKPYLLIQMDNALFVKYSKFDYLLRIDSGQVQSGSLVYVNQSLLAWESLDFVDSFKNGQSVVVRITKDDDKIYQMTFDLAGFTKAYSQFSSHCM